MANILDRTRVNFLDIASREIALGIPVIPVTAGQKSPPLVTGGTTSASTDPEQVAEWARQFPNANVGVVCTLTGICIVDDDEGVIEASGIPVNARVVQSSPGHRQYYFRHTSESALVGNIPQRAGFSLRSHNYYGLAAGSRHPNGHVYTLLNDAPIQPLPSALLEYLQSQHESKTLKGDLAMLNGRKLRAGEGRNDDMLRLAGMIWDGEIEEGEFIEKLARACELRHDPPYPLSRIEDVVRRIMKKPAGPGVDWAELLTDEENGYWIGLRWYSSKETYEAQRPKALTLRELDEQIKASNSIEELVGGMLPARSVNILGGDSGLGKSPLLCQMAVCVAAGIPFLGHATKKSPVLIADFENDYALSGMLHSVAQAVRAPETIFADGSLYILQRPEQQELLQEVLKTRARLVIVDSLRGLDPQAESPKSTHGPQLISDLQDVDCCWLIIHHLRKQPTDQPRPDLDDDNNPVLTWLEAMSGARCLVNQTFTRLAVDRSNRKASSELVLRGYFKGRGEFGPFYLKRIYDEGGEPIGYARLTGLDTLTINQRADLQKVRALGAGLSFGEISGALGADYKASRLLQACRAAGLVHTKGKDRHKDRRYEFSLPEDAGNQ